ncbi:MAG: TonB-dependent receptor [Verrucomicrobia bacterium]|nr:TonB-dependent receptor [Verrucomicrobiota bacterium]
MKNQVIPTIRPLFMLAASTLALAAQDKPATAPEKLKTVVVKGTAIGGQVTAVSPTLTLSSADLDRLSQSNIGDLLAELPGVVSSYFGPNAGRPIIRGLDGDRLKITQNGVNSLDASSSSPDHAVSVDPLAIREAQVLRGPAALLYSTSILGGVINLVDARIPDQRLAQRQSVVGRVGSVDGLRSAGVLAEGSVGSFSYHVDGFDKSTDDLRTPVGRIAGTGADNRGAGLGVSYLTSNGYVGISYSGLDSTYGVAEQDVVIGLEQRRWDLAGKAEVAGSVVRSLSYRLGVADYAHTEFEGGAPESTFTNQGWDGRLDIELVKMGSVEGVVGVQASRFDFGVVGDHAFLPDTRNTAMATFGSFVQTLAPDQRLRYGFRVEHAQVDASAWTHVGVATNPPADSASFTPASFAFAWAKDLNPYWTSTINLTRTERAPNFQELFADGAHVATDVYEVGNRNLGKEQGFGLEWELAKVRGPLSGSFSVYYNRFSSFIALQRNGYGPGDYAQGGPEELARYDFASVPADFVGTEVKVNYQFIDNPVSKLGLEWYGDFVRASNTDTSEALPRISPGRIGVALHGLESGWTWRLDATYHLAQNRTAPDETRTAGFTMVGASLAHPIKFAQLDGQFTLRVINLLDQEARNASSFIKDAMPLPGRGIEAGLRLNF